MGIQDMNTPDNVIQLLSELAAFAATRAKRKTSAFATESDSEDVLLGAYSDRLVAISEAARAAGAVNVLKVCPFAEQNIEAYRTRGMALAATEWILLATWPTLVLNYALQPDQPDVATALIDHLSDPRWPKAFQGDETIATQPAADTPAAREASTIDDAATVDEVNEAVPVADKDDSSPVASSSVERPSADESGEQGAALAAEIMSRLRSAVATLTEVAQARGFAGLLEVTERFHRGLAQLRAATATEFDAVKSLCAQLASAVRAYLAAPGNASASHALVNVLENPMWPAPLSEATRTQLLSLLRAPASVASRHENVVEDIAHRVDDGNTLTNRSDTLVNADDASTSVSSETAPGTPVAAEQVLTPKAARTIDHFSAEDAATVRVDTALP